MRYITSINWMGLITVPLTIWLGYTDRIDWWTIIFVWLMRFELVQKFK